jgi:hypothetical protein
MKSISALAVAMCLVPAVHAADAPAAAPDQAASAPEAASSASAAAKNKYVVKAEDAGFCLYGGKPTGDARYKTVKNVKTSRETYGSVLDELPRFVDTAKAMGADAVIDYNGAQHFGFWPWRLVRPVASGVAIKWDGPAPDCAASGGATFATIMATDKEPPRK